MLTQDICEALYALPGGVVKPRRRTVHKPIFITLLGVVLLIVDLLFIDEDSEAGTIALATAGITLLLYGVVTLITRLRSTHTVPYDEEAKCYMQYRERYYDHVLLPALRKAITTNDRSGLEIIPTSNISAIILVEYRTPGGRRTAYALYEYKEFDYQLIYGPHIITT